jgi:uncharacterized protein (TIGR02145 family)
MEIIAIGAIVFFMWKVTRKKITIPLSEEELTLEETCKNIVYKPLSPMEPRQATLLGKGYCSSGDLKYADYSQGSGDPYAQEQADAYSDRKTEEAIRDINRKVIQFRLINTSAVAITTKVLDTGQDSVPFVPAPSAPIASSVTNRTSSGFTANWSASAGATGYYLDVATDSDFTSYVSGYQNKDVSNVTSYAVTGVSGDTIYYYRLRAYSSSGTSNNSNTITVSALSEVTIGTQTWLLKNVDVDISGSKVYDDDESNREIYGGLYTWDMITEIEALFSGYHVPTRIEWEALLTELGGGLIAGGKLKEIGTTHWDSPNTDADNSSGFTALPGGLNSGSYEQINQSALFWTSTDFGVVAYRTVIYYNSALADCAAGGQFKTNYYSIRLIKD